MSGFHLILIYAVGGSPGYRKDPSPLGKGDQLPKGELVDEAVWRKGIRFQLNKKRTHHFGEIHCDVSNIFLFLRRIFKVKKLKMARGVTLTFEEGCNKEKLLSHKQKAQPSPLVVWVELGGTEL